VSYSLLVFDWDGTIIDSASTIAACIQQASRELGLPVPSHVQASHVIGLGLRDALTSAVPDLPAERYPEFVDAYRKHFLARKDSMQLFDGIRPLLESLAKTHQLAIATGKSRRGLDNDLAHHKLGGHFAASRCADETDPKPHPAMLLELMDELGAARDQSLMVGDTSHDMEMAKAAGVDALAVTYGAHAEATLRACGPRGVLSSVKELREWLKANA
jgi:phosphoglycolate phosphatase